MSDAMDMVIGASGVKADAKAAKDALVEAERAGQAGDRAGQVAALRRAASASPNDPHVLFKLAYNLDLSGEEDEAIALYERVCDFVPPPVNALLNLAVLLEDRGEYAKAERCLRQILDTNPNHARARLFMKDVQASRSMVIEEENERDVMKRKALLDTPVTDFELSVRARTCLKKMNIRTLGDLIRINEAELMSYKNFGESSLEEIKRMLVAKNLKLGQGREDAQRAARRQILEKLKGSGREQMLNKPVSELQLSVRARKALQMLNIQTIGDLCSHTEAELMGIKNFGSTSLVEVREKLGEMGLGLRVLEEGETLEG